MAYQGFSLTRVLYRGGRPICLARPDVEADGHLAIDRGGEMPDADDGQPGRPLALALRSYFVDNGPDRIVHDPETGLSAAASSLSKIVDNPHLLKNDPDYIKRLRASGSPELQRMWIEGDWDAGLEGQFFTEWSRDRHVIEPFAIPEHWIRFRAADWGSAAPFSHRMVCGRARRLVHGGKLLKRGALIRYREYYGCSPTSRMSA